MYVVEQISFLPFKFRIRTSEIGRRSRRPKLYPKVARLCSWENCFIEYTVYTHRADWVGIWYMAPWPGLHTYVHTYVCRAIATSENGED